MGYVGTQAIGHAAIEYFPEGGGDVAGLAALVGKTTSVAAEAAETVASKPAVKRLLPLWRQRRRKQPWLLWMPLRPLPNRQLKLHGNL